MGLAFGRGMALGTSLFLTFFPALDPFAGVASDVDFDVSEFGKLVDVPESQPVTSVAIPYAAMSETSSNCWKLSVINEASCWEYLVDKPSRTSWMAA